MVEYDELKLRIQRGTHANYHVSAFGPDGSTASIDFSLPFDEVRLDNFVLRVGRPRRGTRGYRSSQMREARAFGSKLFDALIAGAVRDVYLGARRVAETHERGLRVTLSMTDVPELLNVPWEFLYERPSFLSQSIYTPLVRSLDLPSVRAPRKLALPLRILGVVSRPTGFASLDVAAEQAHLGEALEPLEREGLVELRWLASATLGELDDAISAPDDVHILHFIGHGAYDERTEDGILVCEDADGSAREVTGEELGSLLQDERSLRLVVLNSCEGARGSHVDPFSGVAASLVEFGIPAVIGMQFEITDEAAIRFSRRLYGALAQGLSVDAAVAQARKAIFAGGNDTEFGTPVLFLRGTDGRLFELERPAPQPAEPPVSEPAPPPPAREPAPPVTEPAEDRASTDWTATLIERSQGRRVLRVELTDEVHVISVSTWMNKLMLDGVAIAGGMQLAGTYEFSLSDGPRSRTATARIDRGLVTWQLALLVEGRLLYEDPGRTLG